MVVDIYVTSSQGMAVPGIAWILSSTQRVGPADRRLLDQMPIHPLPETG